MMTFAGPHNPDPFTNNSWQDFPYVDVPPKWPDTKRTKQLVAEYYNDVNQMDRQFKHFLDIMDRNFGGQKAITIFTSDHGGKHFSKWSSYESGLRVPFFLQHHGMEGMLDTGIRHRNELLSFVDILPTFVDMAGGFLPENAQKEASSDLKRLFDWAARGKCIDATVQCTSNDGIGWSRREYDYGRGLGAVNPKDPDMRKLDGKTFLGLLKSKATHVFCMHCICRVQHADVLAGVFCSACLHTLYVL